MKVSPAIFLATALILLPLLFAQDPCEEGGFQLATCHHEPDEQSDGEQQRHNTKRVGVDISVLKSDGLSASITDAEEENAKVNEQYFTALVINEIDTIDEGDDLIATVTDEEEEEGLTATITDEDEGEQLLDATVTGEEDDDVTEDDADEGLVATITDLEEEEDGLTATVTGEDEEDEDEDVDFYDSPPIELFAKVTGALDVLGFQGKQYRPQLALSENGNVYNLLTDGSLQIDVRVQTQCQSLLYVNETWIGFDSHKLWVGVINGNGRSAGKATLNGQILEPNMEIEVNKGISLKTDEGGLELNCGNYKISLFFAPNFECKSKDLVHINMEIEIHGSTAPVRPSGLLGQTALPNGSA